MEVTKERGIGVTLVGVAVGITAGLGLGWWALAAGGGGHGDVLPALLTFPFAFLAGLAASDFGIALMVIQYPVYGLVLGEAARRHRLWRTVPWLVGVHAVTVVAFFLVGADVA